MKKKIYYFTFAIILVGVAIAIGCRKGNTTDAERASDSKASSRAELLSQLSPRLQNVQDFSNDKDMVEFTKLMDESMEFSRANVYKSLREKKELKKLTIPRNASKSDLKKIYSDVGREDEFEKLSATFDKQATLITSFMKRHPELSKLNKDELSMIFLKAFKLNHVSAPKGNVSIYRKVQENDAAKCQASLASAELANEEALETAQAGVTAGYAISLGACLGTGPGYPACYAVATAAYGVAMLVCQENYNDNLDTNIRDYNICMSGLSRGVNGEYKKRIMMTYSL